MPRSRAITLCKLKLIQHDLDTPWDSPTKRSPEFSRYLSGEIFDELPWRKFSAEALCAAFLFHQRRKKDLTFCFPALVCGMLTVDPRDRFTLPDVFQHPWCLRYFNSSGHHLLYSHRLTDCRPSQLANQGFARLADKLTESIRENGDLGLATPNFTASVFFFPLSG